MSHPVVGYVHVGLPDLDNEGTMILPSRHKISTDTV